MWINFVTCINFFNTR